MDLLQRRMGAIWLFAMVVLAFVIAESESFNSDEKDQIEKGLAAGKEIIDYIKQKDFAQTIRKLTESASQFLGALGPFSSFILAFVSTDSSELTYMKGMMTEIDAQFNKVEARLGDIQTLIEWTNVEQNLGVIELTVATLDMEFKLFYNTSGTASEKQQTFINVYDNNYATSGSKLYLMTVGEGGTFIENLCESIMKKTKYDRKETNDYLLGVLKILLQAIRLELAYYGMQGLNTTYETRKNEWDRRITQVTEMFEKTDEDVINAYHTQSKEDAKRFAIDNRALSNRDFAVRLCDMLKEKYYWREWFCLIYDDSIESSSSKHRLHVCGGHILLQESGRNIAVASKETTATRMSKASAEAELNKFTFSYWWDVLYDGTEIDNGKTKAYTVFNKIRYNIANVCSVAVIKQNADVYWHKSDTSRLATRSLHHYWWVFAFG
ncbi:unnamed protein product [Owenia fusiformis]|uniref:Uncharacterized protein n=1 Tax=Owenia fusiformis TaxID=6347 RepID=A0A8J1TKT9_OWEFU|nr:unnamed protein product [Owenia fusiformis]